MKNSSVHIANLEWVEELKIYLIILVQKSWKFRIVFNKKAQKKRYRW